jgi:glycosyltransferase involved in cell wall biosynthesis
MSAPAFSVVLPNYNYARFIGDTIQSVLDQTCKDYELIVVDDGSTDNSAELIESFVQKNPERMRLVRKANKGLPSARNAAWPHCRGRFIAFLDSDDLWTPDFLEKILEFFETNPGASAVYTNAELFQSASGQVLGNWFGPMSYRTPHSGWIADKLFLNGNFIPIVTGVVRREVVDKAGFFDERFKVGEDWDFWLRVSSQYEIHYIDRVCCRIRRHPANLSFRSQNAFNAMHIYRKILVINPGLKDRIGPAKMADVWYRAYYEAGRVLVLAGCRWRARRMFLKALKFRRDWFARPMWMYYPLTYFPWPGQIGRIRRGLVRFRSVVSPRAH